MSGTLNHLVVSGDHKEVTLKWNVQNPFEASVPSYSRIESTRARVFEEDWYFVIRPCTPDFLYIYIRRENFKDENAKTIYVNFKIMSENELLSDSRYTEESYDRDVCSYLFLNALRKFKNVASFQIICTAKWCNPPSIEPEEPVQESFKNRHDFLKISVSKGQELLSGVSKDFHELLVTRRNADVHIDVKGEMILAHQSVLEARCPVFAAMFSHNMSESRNRVITITDCEPAHFQDFLVYLYTGKVDHIKGSNASDLYKISDKYDRPELKKLCKKHILSNLSQSTFIDTLYTADIYNDSEMLKSATKYFIKNGFEFVKTREWQDFVKGNPNLMTKIFEKLFQMNAFGSMKTASAVKRPRTML